MMRVSILSVTLLAVIAVAGASVAARPASDSTIRVEHDKEAFVTRITIRATHGRIAWADVIRGLARARGHDDTALQGVLPEGRFQLTSIQWQLIRTGLNLALSPNVRFDVEPAKDPRGEPRLVIWLDRAALLASKRRFKASLRNALLRLRPGDKDRRGLVFDDGWSEAPAEKNLVVFLHGFNSNPEVLEGLLSAARRQQFPCAVFRYPNDQTIIDSAKLLHGELKALAKDNPGRGVSLVTHSMGGLVARAVIEDPELDPGNVRRLIMIAPPNHGSLLAHFAFGLDLWEHVTDDARRKEAGLFYALIEDGLSEAGIDLRPGSQFLRKLNARRRNPKVRYTIFLGSSAPLSTGDLAQLRKMVADAGKNNRWMRFFGPNVQKWLGDLDEVVDGKGDGVVAIKRGRLEGVEDTMVLRFGHAAFRSAPRGDAKRVQQQVLKRLRRAE